jgi:hypothetical protein
MRILLSASACLAWIGCARDPENCCDAFSPSEDAGIYCLAHRDAVLRFVRAGEGPVEQGARLEWVRSVLKKIEPLKTSDEVDAYLVGLEPQQPKFVGEYDKQHFWAGRDTNLGVERRGELMKCGFRHAVHELEAR